MDEEKMAVPMAICFFLIGIILGTVWMVSCSQIAYDEPELRHVLAHIPKEQVSKAIKEIADEETKTAKDKNHMAASRDFVPKTEVLE